MEIQPAAFEEYPSVLWRGGAFRYGTTTGSGFTLLETVVVLVVVGILAAVLAPRFIGTSGFTGQTTADKLLMAARYAETLAQNQGIATALTVGSKTLGSTTFAVTQNGSPVPDPTLQSARFVVPFPPGVTVTPSTTVTFVRGSGPSLAPTFTVTGQGPAIQVHVTAAGDTYECHSGGPCPP